MAYSYIQGVQGTLSQSGATSTVTITSTAGNLLVLGSRQTGEFRDVISISDNQGGMWAPAAPNRYGNSSARDLWYCQNAPGGNTAITITYDSTVTVAVPTVLEYSGIRAVGALEASASVGTVGVFTSSMTTPIMTPTSNATYLLVAFVHEESNRTIDALSGFTNRIYATNPDLPIDDLPRTTLLVLRPQ